MSHWNDLTLQWPTPPVIVRGYRIYPPWHRASHLPAVRMANTPRPMTCSCGATECRNDTAPARIRVTP